MSTDADVTPRVTDGPVLCLLSHKCGDDEHNVVGRIDDLFREHAICAFVDPFSCGADIRCRIETLEMEALLFLSSSASLASAPCAQERNVAKRDGVPLFVVRLDGAVPFALSRRLYVDVPRLGAQDRVQAALRELALVIHNRGLLYRYLRSLPQLRPDDSLEIARYIADASVVEAIAEFVPLIERVYEQIADPSARAWMAIALQRPQTREAALARKRLLMTEREAYPRAALEGDSIRRLVFDDPKKEDDPQ